MSGLDPKLGSEVLLAQLKGSIYAEDKADRTSAEEISSMLGGSPLLINQAGGVIKACGYTLDEFITRPILVDRKVGANKYYYERSLEDILDYTLEKMTESALRLLFMLAFFDHTYIREDLLLRDCDRGYLEFLPPGNSR